MSTSVGPVAPPGDVAPTGPIQDSAVAPCLNCGAALVGPYCAQCGQRALPPRPTLAELAREVWDEAVSLDGRFVTSLRLLVTRPGRLTIETHAGRRARYLGPVRLYLLCSVAFFVAESALPERSALERQTAARASVARAPAATPDSCRPVRPGEPALGARLRAVDCKTDRDPERFQALRRQNVPRLMFVLLPLYAGLLALLFRGHTYPEHLVFALHLHAFTFLAALVARGADLLPHRKADGVVDAAVWLGVIAYSLVALRRVYGRTWKGTITRGVLLGAVYGGVFLLGLIAVVVATALLM